VGYAGRPVAGSIQARADKLIRYVTGRHRARHGLSAVARPGFRVRPAKLRGKPPL